MSEYTQCYFAFIDILGFKYMMNTLSCSAINDIFDELKQEYVIRSSINGGPMIPVIPHDDIHYYIMSDSICIYIRSSIFRALPILVALCMNLQVRLLCRDTPVFVRGSISKGEIFGDNGVLFGPAMVEAYKRSEELAKTPRIIVPANLYDETVDRTEKALLNGFLYLEPDGFYATNYINYFCFHNSAQPYRDSVKRHISNQLSASLNQSIREKYLYVDGWMRYWTERYDRADDAPMQ